MACDQLLTNLLLCHTEKSFKMIGESPEGETSSVPTTKIKRICACDAAVLSKMAEPSDESNWTIWCEKMCCISRLWALCHILMVQSPVWIRRLIQC